jgi:heptosyltransferase-1
MRRAVIAPASTLDAVATSLAAAHVVIGVDTGLAHLAAALGRPTVAIYCDYDPALVGLVGDGPRVSLGGAGIVTPSSAVIDAVEQVTGRT